MTNSKIYEDNLNANICIFGCETLASLLYTMFDLNNRNCEVQEVLEALKDFKIIEEYQKIKDKYTGKNDEELKSFVAEESKKIINRYLQKLVSERKDD